MLSALSSDDCQELTELIRLATHYAARLSALALKCPAKSREALDLRYARTKISEVGFAVQRVLELTAKKE